METQETSDESSLTSFTTVSVESPPPEKLSVPVIAIETDLAELYSENVIAKIWRVASTHGKDLPTRYPHTVPQTGEKAGKYEYREADFWTCGFFPGSLYALLERSVKYPKFLPIPDGLRSSFREELLKLCHYWDAPIHNMSSRTDTHDMGFIVQPSLRTDWELNGNVNSLQSVINAAIALASRYDDRVKAIRSWNNAINNRYSIIDQDTNFLVIVDSMCNLDLLFYVGHHIGDQHLIDIATTHARFVLQHVVRDDFSTNHLVNFDPQTGLVKQKMTNQGFSDTSTWTRGQGWAILGFTQVYVWTKDPTFLSAAVKLTEYFLRRLGESKSEYPNVPPWDFDAPWDDDEPLIRDTSAGMIAANGMLLLHQIQRTAPASVHSIPSGYFLDASLTIIRQTIALSLSQAKLKLSRSTSASISVIEDEMSSDKIPFDAILRNATANRNPDAKQPYWDHGLIYCDYYFLEAGNKLLRMGLL